MDEICHFFIGGTQTEGFGVKEERVDLRNLSGVRPASELEEKSSAELCFRPSSVGNILLFTSLFESMFNSSKFNYSVWRTQHCGRRWRGQRLMRVCPKKSLQH